MQSRLPQNLTLADAEAEDFVADFRPFVHIVIHPFRSPVRIRRPYAFSPNGNLQGAALLVRHYFRRTLAVPVCRMTEKWPPSAQHASPFNPAQSPGRSLNW